MRKLLFLSLFLFCACSSTKNVQDNSKVLCYEAVKEDIYVNDNLYIIEPLDLECVIDGSYYSLAKNAAIAKTIQLNCKYFSYAWSEKAIALYFIPAKTEKDIVNFADSCTKFFNVYSGEIDLSEQIILNGDN